MPKTFAKRQKKEKLTPTEIRTRLLKVLGLNGVVPLEDKTEPEELKKEIFDETRLLYANPAEPDSPE